MKTLKTTLFIILTSAFVNLFSQEIPIPILERINQVDYIFEGVVIESNPYFIDNDRTIYTSNTIEIHKVFKGDISCGTIELICEDGEINGVEQTSSHALNLTVGQIGVFLGKQTNKELSTIDFYSETNSEKIEATYQNQSFIKYWYDGINYQASDLWLQYDSIEQFYSFTQQVIGYSYLDCNNSTLPLSTVPSKSSDNFLISLVYPTNINGGISDTLNITGLGFGSTRGNGNVYLNNADDGGTTKVSLDSFLLWSDTLIKFIVPSIDANTADNPAGSGFIKIVTDNGDSEISDDFVTVNYSIYNGSDKKPKYIAPHSVNNQTFTFHCDTSVANFSNGKMKMVIKRALLDWSCLTGINWILGNDTFGIQYGYDSINIIVFNDSLSAHVVASARSFNLNCGLDHFIPESDILIDSSYFFYYDTLNNTHNNYDSTDFYHVILHELGHAHHLNHTIDVNGIMHYTLLNDRVIDLINDISCYDGGNWIMDTSLIKTNGCIDIQPILQVFPQNGCGFDPTAVKQYSKSSIQVYPNPTKGYIVLKFDNKTNRNIRVYNVNSILIKNISTKESEFQLNLVDLPKGMYFLSINDNKNNNTFKIIKK